MKKDVPFNPPHIRQLGTLGVTKATHTVASLVQ